MTATGAALLRTARMRGEPLGPEHEDEIAELTLDPRVYRTLWPWSRAPTRADVRASLTRARRHWERRGYGLWMLRDARTGAAIGRGGLQRTTAVEGRTVEVAWAITPERWGNGLATELAFASLAVAFDELRLESVVALTLPDNLASRRVMEKAGFAYERDLVHAGLPHVLYRCRAPVA